MQSAEDGRVRTVNSGHFVFLCSFLGLLVSETIILDY